MAKIHARDCPNCGKNFKPPKNEQKYCSIPCGHEGQSKEFRAKIQAIIDAGEMPQTRLSAVKAGAKFYQGKECLKGHIGIRNTTCGMCVFCMKDKHARQRMNKTKQAPSVSETASLITSPYWLHILPTWQPVIVERRV